MVETAQIIPVDRPCCGHFYVERPCMESTASTVMR